jgi:allantoin racemase
MQLLILNPNTSAAVTDRLCAHVAAIAAPGVTLRTATAAFGARYIADEASFAVAGHAALDAYARHCDRHGEPDAVLLGCFGDPGVWALREWSGRPVVGLAEAAMRQAAGYGRFAIVTGGAAWDPMLRRLAQTLSLAGALTDVHTVAPTGAQLAADPAMALSVLGAACQRAAVGAQAVILGGAGLAGMAAGLAHAVAVPVIDSVSAAALALFGDCSGLMAITRGVTGPADWQGVSAALARTPR